MIALIELEIPVQSKQAVSPKAMVGTHQADQDTVVPEITNATNSVEIESKPNPNSSQNNQILAPERKIRKT